MTWKAEKPEAGKAYLTTTEDTYCVVSDDTGAPLVATAYGEANARLIAAAPDLLAALREVYEAYLAPPEESADFDWDAWGKRAQVAIHKATEA